MSTTTATETMTDAYDGLKFVTVDPNASSTPRTKELARSAARSHASLVVHRKRQAANRKRVASDRLILNTELPDTQCEPTKNHDGDNEYSEDYGSLADWPALAPLHLQSALCLELLAPNTRAVHEVFHVDVFWEDCWMRWLSNETFYSAFVARIQACRDAPSGIRPKSQPSTSVLRREQGAIDALQRELTRNVEVDEQYLVAMMQLGLLEGELGPDSSAASHMDAVSRVLQQRLGGEIKNGRIRPMLQAFVLTRAMEIDFDNSPLCLAYAPDEPSLEARPTSPPTPGITKVLPVGFAALAEADLLSIEVTGVLERVVHLWNRITKGLSLSSSSFSSDSGKGKGKATELTPNFWSACPSLAVSIPPDEEPTIDNLLALDLWLYVALEFSNRSIAESMLLWASMSRSARPDLSTGLMRCVVSRHSDEEDCLMWLFEIAVASWTGPNGALLPQGLALLELRYIRSGYRSCPFHKFFHFSKNLKWPDLSPQQDMAGRLRRRNILRAPESWTRLKFS